MRSTKRLFVVLVAGGTVLASGCTSVLVPRVEHPPDPEPAPAAEAEVRLSIARVALSAGGQTAIVLEEDGRIVHPTCEGRLDASGTVRDRGGETVLQLTASGAIVDRDGREAFMLDGSTLRRASGATAQLAEGRVAFEGSPELAIEVERSEAAEDRTVLLLVAAMSVCER